MPYSPVTCYGEAQSSLRSAIPQEVRRFLGGYMPEICRFFGIVIKMFYNDHQPPHFHAEYSGAEALILIESLEIYRGEFPRRALALVLEGAVLHRDELRSAWQMAQGGHSPQPISPLE